MQPRPRTPLKTLPPLPPLRSRNRNPSTTKPLPKPFSPQKRPNKSTQNIRKRKPSVQIKTKYKISNDHLNFLIEQQRNSDLNIIRSSIALNYYYEALMSLFGVIYSSSQIIVANMFEEKKMSTGLSGLKFVGVLFSLYEFVWNQVNIAKLRTMAKNVIKMGSTTSTFQQKIQFICRKITLNYNMQSRIQMSFLNPNLQKFWHRLLNKLKLTDQIELLQTMYETSPQKMAYWDFNHFINHYLANQQFYTVLKSTNRYDKNKQYGNCQDNPMHSFTYQFVVVEIFCFMGDEDEGEEGEEGEVRLGGKGKGEEDGKKCQLI